MLCSDQQVIKSWSSESFFSSQTLKHILVWLDDKSNEIHTLGAADMEEMGFSDETARKIKEEILSCPVGLGDWEILKVIRVLPFQFYSIYFCDPKCMYNKILSIYEMQR